MLVNAQTLDLVFQGFKTVYTDAFLKAEPNWDKIAMQSTSVGADETYGWMGQFPQLREWLGPRVIHNLEAHGFKIVNRKFESTVKVSRDHISDDKLGVFKPAFSEMGHLATNHPEELVFNLLASGFETECYDGQYFFDTDHPTLNPEGEVVSVSNMQAGAEPPWFLLDTSRAVRPIIWQEREKYEFEAMDRPTDEHVFKNDEYLYGVRARVNAGFGLWQLGFGSKAELTAANYAAARAAMMNFKSDTGRILGVKPMMLVVPPALEEAALKIVNTEFNDGGGTNPWSKTADLLVTPYLAA
ncbi:Mu-like prophage major head subunit gpT family protein [Sulfitobacter sp. F26204]|uniref:Mu-like prophage major head subunit gpT family protein n=1 Tax=Sulfitobacter sp. F26204 TaxID=2996014 RepID=UPI00225E03A6|nr:Mu-like prophage major head subunit gpT family protein [Sulfitobacter sp. F26204]MCX7559113.1 Mu-like prophage major head subunit gpT family protein [Sulfitobacter sp. F26204]